MPPTLEDLTFRNGPIELHAVAAGPHDGPVVMLLHGFPEFWYSWHKQVDPLAGAGFRVVAPDQRGYNLSSKPRGVANYALVHLVSDVIAIADQLDARRFFLAGHDWGGAVAWSAATLHPQRIAKLGILNVPHPSVMLRYMNTNPRQIRRSWYMFLLQIPWLPEMIFRARDFRFGVNAFVNSSRPGTFTSEDIVQYRGAWSQPGALTGSMNWYRAAARHRSKLPDPIVHVPTRMLWGERDAFLLPQMAQDSLRYCDSAELYAFANASHWLQHEEPQRVCELLIDFFRG